MLKFDLCYRVNEDRVLIPDLLSVQEPNFDLPVNNKFSFIVDYDFLPKSILARFIVLRQEYIYRSLQWRTGVVLKHRSDNTFAVIIADYSEKKIRIDIYGNKRADMLTIVRITLLSINDRYEKVNFVEKIPLPDLNSVLISYKHLCLLQENGIKMYIPDGASKAYNVEELLGLVRSTTSRTEDEFMEMLKSVVNKKDNKDSVLAKANEIVMLQPNFAGIGINFNALISRFFQND